jgi:uncharacterized protein (TIGR00159 family)
METIREMLRQIQELLMSLQQIVSVADVVDILIITFLIYQILSFMRKTSASSVIRGIILVLIVAWAATYFNMIVLSYLLEQVLNMGLVVLIVLFQPEIRRFLVNLGTKYRMPHKWRFEKLFASDKELLPDVKIKSIAKACIHMSESKTGALIVIARSTSLKLYAETGDIINANASSRLLENIFFKNTPLHDGAVIIEKDRIHAARCILPVSESRNLPPNLGLRHRAALGVTENSDAFAIIVSEETGNISIADHGIIRENLSKNELLQNLEKLVCKD